MQEMRQSDFELIGVKHLKSHRDDSGFIDHHSPSRVTNIDGIGRALGKKLKAKGFDKAEVLLGQLLSLKKNKDAFIAWMMDRPDPPE